MFYTAAVLSQWAIAAAVRSGGDEGDEQTHAYPAARVEGNPSSACRIHRSACGEWHCLAVGIVRTTGTGSQGRSGSKAVMTQVPLVADQEAGTTPWANKTNASGRSADDGLPLF